MAASRLCAFALKFLQRGVAGKCQLRGEEQFPAGFPGVGAGCVGAAQGGPDWRKKVCRGRERRRASGDVGVLSGS